MNYLGECLFAVLPHELRHLLAFHENRPYHEFVEGVPEATDLEQCFRCHRNRHFRNQTCVIGVREQAVVGRHAHELKEKRKINAPQTEKTESLRTLMSLYKFSNYVW